MLFLDDVFLDDGAVVAVVRLDAVLLFPMIVGFVTLSRSDT